MPRMIRTSRQDIYIRLVENAKPDRDGDADEAPGGEDEYLFQYQYELFSFAAAWGFLRCDPIPEPDEYSQDIRRLSDMPPDDPHRASIEFIAKLVEIEEDIEDDEAAWDVVLRYADAGVEDLNDEFDTPENFDLVWFVRESDGEAWLDRLVTAIGEPGEVSTLAD